VDNVLVLLGAGDGTFGAALPSGSGNAPRSLAVGDFNHDGIQDLAVARTPGNTPYTDLSDVSILLGRGDGTFGSEIHYPTNLGASAVVTADFDHDGHLDLFLTNGVTNDLSMLWGLGDGTLGPQLTFPAGSAPAAAVAANLNQDSAVDVAIVNSGSQEAWILLNQSMQIAPITIDFGSPLGHGSGVVSWTTSREVDLRGFNIITLDNAGRRTQLNPALISCDECVTGSGATYSFIVSKHKGGNRVFIEAIHINGGIETFGPAERI